MDATIELIFIRIVTKLIIIFLLISRGTNYSLILARNFSADLLFHMCKIQIAMATSLTSQCQDGGIFLWRFRKTEHKERTHQEGFYQVLCRKI